MNGHLEHFLLDIFSQIWTQWTLRLILGPILVIFDICHFFGGLSLYLLGGLSLYLNHLIGSCVTNYNWQFETLPFGIFLVKFGHNGP